MTGAAVAAVVDEIAREVAEGRVVPYLGPGLFREQGGAPFPAAPQELAQWLAARVAVPGRLRGRLTAAAQYIESYKHRKTLVSLMREAFAPEPPVTPVHRLVATFPRLPLVVDSWYDGAMARALAEAGRAFCLVRGVSRQERPDRWFEAAGPEGETVLYKPLGCLEPEPSFLLSDSDYVEVLTEIDIQTPIPPVVQELRRGCRFLFLGCRFSEQVDRIFARQIMKRSSDHHWAVLPGESTRNEARFLAAQNIEPLPLDLGAFAAALARALQIQAAAGRGGS